MTRWHAMRFGGLLAAVWLLAGAATAQINLGRNHDSNQPIEISADSLEVQQDKQIAIFRGNVDAVQGDIHLRADQLKVYYRDKSAAEISGKAGSKIAAKNGKPARPVGKSAAGRNEAAMGNSISRIDAIGKVFISSPEETAQGDTGVYDLDKRTIVLEGRSVVLTRGPNVLRGQRVVMNLETGKSVMETAPGGRVKGLFVPQKKEPGK